MKDLARNLLNPDQHKQVAAAVAAAEKQTSGEIVCLIESTSYHYPMANVLGGATLALPLALLLTPLAGAWLWIGTSNMWLFLGIFTLLFCAGFMAVKHIPGLKHFFISQREMDEEVEEAAVTTFFLRGLYRTRESNGILLYISVFERKVWLLADKGINDKVPRDHWDDLVTELTRGLRRRQAADALCRAVTAIGEDLKLHFPYRADDTNELENVIVEGREGA